MKSIKKSLARYMLQESKRTYLHTPINSMKFVWGIQELTHLISFNFIDQRVGWTTSKCHSWNVRSRWAIGDQHALFGVNLVPCPMVWILIFNDWSLETTFTSHKIIFLRFPWSTWWCMLFIQSVIMRETFLIVALILFVGIIIIKIDMDITIKGE